MKRALRYVRRRRWLYAAFVLATLTLAFLPLFHDGSFAGDCEGLECLAAMPLEAVTCLLPDCIMPWTEVWSDVVQNLYAAGAMILVAVALVRLKMRWHAATRQHADSAWADLKAGE